MRQGPDGLSLKRSGAVKQALRRARGRRKGPENCQKRERRRIHFSRSAAPSSERVSAERTAPRTTAQLPLLTQKERGRGAAKKQPNEHHAHTNPTAKAHKPARPSAVLGAFHPGQSGHAPGPTQARGRPSPRCAALRCVRVGGSPLAPSPARALPRRAPPAPGPGPAGCRRRPPRPGAGSRRAAGLRTPPRCQAGFSPGASPAGERQSAAERGARVSPDGRTERDRQRSAAGPPSGRAFEGRPPARPRHAPPPPGPRAPPRAGTTHPPPGRDPRAAPRLTCKPRGPAPAASRGETLRWGEKRQRRVRAEPPALCAAPLALRLSLVTRPWWELAPAVLRRSCSRAFSSLFFGGCYK